ncbi:MAG: energy transducer TonB, partial [Thermodesulfobacteriota bacterium]
VSPKPSLQPKQKKASTSELIDSALSRVEKQVAEKNGNQVEDVIADIAKRLESKTQSESGNTAEKPQGSATPNPRRTQGTPGGFSGVGKGIQLYQWRIEGKIKENWSYPVALVDAREKKLPEAVVVLILRSDGKILHSEFKKKSRDPLFNDSVLKALERSDPLPEFPPGYKKSSDEVEIRFSLKDLIQ